MIDVLQELDKDLFLFLNSLHSSWLDQPMYWFSNTLTWFPLYFYLAFLILKNYKSESWIIFLGIILTIVMADQISSTFIKPLVERLRPSRDPLLEDLVHTVNNYHGGLYGFVSSHAANTFGLAMFMYLLMHKTRKGIFILFFWAAFISFTRIYLGVHYPGDIIGGAIVGSLCAILCFRLSEKVREKWVARDQNVA